MFELNGKVEMNVYGYFVIEVRTGKKKAVKSLLKYQDLIQVLEVAEEFRKDFVNYIIVRMFSAPETVNNIYNTNHVKSILGKLKPEESKILISKNQQFAA